MTTYTLRKGNPATTRTDAVVIGVRREGTALRPATGAEAVAAAYGRRFASTLTALGFGAERGQVIRFPSAGTIKAATVVAVGLGSDPTPEDPGELRLRAAAGVAARNLGNVASVALALPMDTPARVRAVTEGFLSGGYGYRGARSGKAEGGPADVVVLSDLARRQDAARAFEIAQVTDEQARLVRDWVNTPPNELTPAAFAEAAAGLPGDLSTEVLGPEELADLGCGGILAVGAGSANPPRLLRLRWRPDGATRTVALVGKGITYDSGGLTIKPSGSMATMKNDMAGAAAVIGTIRAAAALDLPVEVVALAPMAENMPSGSAMRPGDVIRMRNGKTVEITNTDAEGRLVLADALSLAAEEGPDRILEISTLTGPCVIALGDRIAGLFGTPEVVAEVRGAAERAGERVWPLPIPEHIATAVGEESPIADVLQHNWVRWGSASFAAAFLTQFTGTVPFAHLDIAGPAWNAGAAWADQPAGATGFGVRTLLGCLSDLSSG